MKKLIELEPSYYRINLFAGNVIYLSHAKDVREEEYITLSIKDIVYKIDELVEAYGGLATAIQNFANEIPKLRIDAANVDARISKLETELKTPIENDTKHASTA